MYNHCRIFMIFLLLVYVPEVKAAEFLPPSHHELHIPIGIFNEEQSGILFRDSARAWGLLGGDLALWGGNLGNTPYQVVLSTMLWASWREQSFFLAFLTETFDIRMALLMDIEFSKQLRLSAGLQHLSGHTADSVQDPSLVPLDVGDEVLQARVTADPWPWLRIGATAKPIFISSPQVGWLGLDQFCEIFPWGGPLPHTSTLPYLAVGLEQVDWGSVELNAHIQAGLLWGNHLAPVHASQARVVLGAYSGMDPRLKYAMYLHTHVQFVYVGGIVKF